MCRIVLMIVLAVLSNSVMAEFTCEKIKDKTTRASCITDRVEKEKAVEAKKEAEAAEKRMASKHAEETRIAAAQRDNEVKAAENLTKSKRNFDNALRSALAISAATEVGVTYVNFGQLLNSLATEIAMIKGQATTPFETDTVDNLNKILDIYKDSSSLWADLIEVNSGAGMKLNDDYIIFGFYPRTAEITRKYDLPITKDNSPIFRGPDSLYGPGARSILWKNASSLVEILRASIQGVGNSGSQSITAQLAQPITPTGIDQMKPGKVFRDCPDCPEMVILPKPFAMGKYEVTQGEWKAVMGNNPSYFSNCGDTCPVEKVSWNDTQEFIRKLNQKTGKQYRLPTGAEWEYACYGGLQSEYCGGNDLNAVAWYKDNSNGQTHPTGQKQANGYGLHDMSGNVLEWIQDCNDSRCDGRGVRGGSWHFISYGLRSATRVSLLPGEPDGNNGFRVARTLP